MPTLPRMLELFWGSLGLTLSAIYLLRPSVLIRLKHGIADEAPFAFLYGLLSLLAGLATVVAQPWGTSVPGHIVSLFGWLSSLKGAMLVGWPDVVKRPRFETRVATTRVSLVAVALSSAYVIASPS